MTLDLWLTFLILACTIGLFILDKIRMDIIGLLALLALFLTGILEAEQVFAGFANSTVIIIAGLFVVGRGLFRAGVATWLGQQFLRLAGTNPLRLLTVLMFGTAGLSGFMSNTGTVAVLLPAVVTVAQRLKQSPAKLLMPLAVAANIGGLLTLIGTLPNIVLSDALVAAGERPLGFFEFTWVGFPLLLLGVGYMLLIGYRLLPDRKGEQHSEVAASLEEIVADYHLAEFLFHVQVPASSPLVGQTLGEINLGRAYNVSVIHIDRVADHPLIPGHLVEQLVEQVQLENGGHPATASSRIEAEDNLLVKGRTENINRMIAEFGLSQAEQADDELNDNAVLSLSEVVIPPRSTVIGRTLQEAQLGQKYNVQVLGVLRGGQRLPTYRTDKMAFGDVLLINCRPEDLDLMRNEPRNFVVIGEPINAQPQGFTPRAAVASGLMLMMLVLLLFSLVPMAIAVTLTALLMVLSGCLSMEQAYRAINWESVVLIAAMLPMNTALQVTGGSEFIVNTLLGVVGSNPLLLLAGIFLLTAAFTQVTSNTATSVLLAPIAISAAQNLGISPYPVIMMVAVGASSAFVTPIASPVNMLVLNPGGYTFADFGKVGIWLVGLFLLVGLLLVPWIWPL